MKVLSWGANSYSQLGHGVKSEQCVVPVEVENSEPFLELSRIVAITGGGGHTLVLDKDGKVYGCGWNNKCQLGASVDSEFLILKQLNILDDYEIREVACGWESSLAITKSGKLLAWGSNAYCELGQSLNKTKFTAKPIHIPTSNIQSLSCGLRHTALVADTGQVFVWGTGRKGQLGLTLGDGNAQTKAVLPVVVAGVSNVRTIACGQHHTVALTDSGKLFVWGDNRHGQLGLDPALHPSVLSPMEIQPFPKEMLSAESRLYCGWTHSVLVTEGGTVYNWGRNTYGELGCFEYQRPSPWKPTELESVHNVQQMAVGSEHNIALLDSGEVVSWGWNEHGNCGTGTEENVFHPTSVGIGNGCKAILIGTGAGHSFALVED